MEGNVWRPTHLTSEQMEERRLVAATLLRQGQLSQADIARYVGVCRWAATLAQEGPRGLEARAIPGPSPRLDEKAWTRLGRLLDRGAVAAGFASERWTLGRIAALIEREFGVHYHPRYLERPLKAHGFSVQRPATRAKERDELVIAVWPKRDWVALKKSMDRPCVARGLCQMDERRFASIYPASGWSLSSGPSWESARTAPT
jgi:transposase